MSFQKYAIVGGGDIGAGSAVRLAMSGRSVVILEIQEGVARSKQLVWGDVQSQVPKKLSAVEAGIVLGRISWTIDPKVAYQDSKPDIAWEFGPEKLEVKKAIVEIARRHLREGVPIITGSSAIMAELFDADANAHPMNPVRTNRGFEFRVHEKTPDGLADKLWQEALDVKFVPFWVDTIEPGFVANGGVFFTANLLGCKLLVDGYSIEEIEAASAKAFGLKVGVFTWMNFTKPEITADGAVAMADLGEWMTVPENLGELVAAGGKWKWDRKADVDEARVAELVELFRGCLFAGACRVVPFMRDGWHELNRLYRVCFSMKKAGPVDIMREFGREKVVELIGRYRELYPSFPEVVVPEDFETAFEPHDWRLELNNETGIANLVLNSPESLGALSSSKLTQLEAHIGEIVESDCHICVVTSNCGSFAGADVVEMGGMDSAAFSDYMRLGQRVFDLMRNTDGIHFIGVAWDKVLGGGLEFLQACDYVVVPEGIKCGFPEMSRKSISAVPGFSGIFNVVDGVGPHMARRILYRPDENDGVFWRLLLCGCAHDVLGKDDDLQAYVRKHAAMQAGLSPDALATMKRLIREISQNPGDRAAAGESVALAMGELLKTEPTKTAIDKFAGKRR